MLLEPKQIFHLTHLVRAGQEAFENNLEDLGETFQFLLDAQSYVWKRFGFSFEDTTDTVIEALTELWDEEQNYDEDGGSFFIIGPQNLLSIRRVDPISGQVTEIRNQHKS